jgi:hypothetical protein
MTWTRDARVRWEGWYRAIDDDVHGLVGALTSRAEAHVLRLALTLAVADRTASIRLEHLEAALAIWAYSEATVQWVWGGLIGNAIADEILRALEEAGVKGLSRTMIRDLFSHDRRASGVDAALAVLEEKGLASRRLVPTSGRHATWWWHHEFFVPVSPGPSGTKGTEGVASGGFGRFGPAGSRSGDQTNDGREAKEEQ